MVKEQTVLIEKIRQDFLDAYKMSKGNEAKRAEKDFLGLIKSEFSKNTKEPSDSEVISQIKNLIKNNNSSIEKIGVPTLTDAELAILNSYLPQEMSEDEIDAKLKELVDAGADNIGRIMGGFKGLGVDMKIVKQKADEILNK